MDSGLTGFFQQIPGIFLVMFCGSGILLVGAIAFMINDRARKARQPAFNGPGSLMSAMPPDDLGGSDLPDLSTLLDTNTLASGVRTSRMGTFAVQLTEGGTLEAVEVLAILRDVSDGTLLIQIGDQVYRNPPALADAEFKRRFNTTVRELAQGVLAAPPPALAADPVSPDLPPAAQPAVPMPTPRTGVVPPVVPGDLPKFKMPDLDMEEVKRRRGRRLHSEPIPEINIAGAIEAFLQHKLETTGDFAGRSIHVRPAVDGGVRIEVDGKFYEGVTEVEDQAVRDYLSATIQEWQERQ